MSINSNSQLYDQQHIQMSAVSADSATNAFQMALLQQDNTVMTICNDNRIIQAVKNKDTAGLKTVIGEYKARNSNLDVMTITDNNAVVLARSASDKAGDRTTAASLINAAAGTSYLGLETVPDTAMTANNLGDRLTASGATQGMSITCTRPIKDDSGNIIGAMAGSKFINDDTMIVDSISATSKTDISIYVGDTRIASTLKGNVNGRSIGSKASAEVASAVINGGNSYDGKATVENTQYYMDYEPLRSADGKIIGMMASGIDLTAENAQMNNNLLQSIGVGAVIAIIAMLAGFFVVTRTTKPINRLVVAANSVAAGNLDTAIETGVKGGEIGQLTDAIKKMVANIKERIAYNESILKNIPDPMSVYDNERNITFMNDVAAAAIGVDAKEVVGKKCYNVYKSPACSTSCAVLECWKRDDVVRNFETTVKAADGGECWIRGNAAPLKDAAGKTVGAMELFKDISKERADQQKIEKAEKEAREKAAFSDAILKAINDGHIVCDLKGNVTYINEVAMKLLGVGEKESIGSTLESVMGVANSVTRKAINENRDLANIESTLTSRSGQKIPAMGHVMLIRGIDGKTTGVNVMFRDITREKEAKKQLAEITVSANKIAERVSGASGNVASSVQQVMGASRQISESIQQIASGSQTQAKSIENVNKLMHDMSSSISSVTEGAKKTSEDAVKANLEAKKSSENAKVAIRKMEELHDAVNDSAKIVTDLGEKSKQIGQIVDMITAIAGQTNLLALNAAIEAARAGDAGRGFAVVAEEVRKLAEEAAKAAEEINSLIGEVREQTSRAVESMNKGTKEVDASNKIVAESLKSLEDISNLIDTTAAKAQEIAAMTEKQAADTQRVVKDIEDMAAVIEESAAGAEEVSASSEETTSTSEQVAGMASDLAKIAEELKAEVSRLKVE